MPNASEDQDDDNVVRIDLGPVIRFARQAINSTLAPIQSSGQESHAIMKKHLLRSQAELLKGLLALVEDEEKRSKQPPAPRNRKPEKVAVE